MSMESLVLDAPDGHKIAAKFRAAEGKTRGLVQILHGMAEHCARYADVADAMAAEGWAVVMHDHRGHGPATPDADLGHFADEDGWQRVIDDVRQVREMGRERAPDGPLVLLGHSMGSFIALYEQCDRPGTVDKLVLSGSNKGGGALVSAGLGAAKFERFRQGPRGKSKTLAFLSFGSFNKGFPGRTDFDWLSRDAEHVDRYVSDAYCGFDCTNQLWIELLGAIIANGRQDRLRRLPKDLGVYLLNGSRDPVSGGGVGVKGLEVFLRQAGLNDVTRREYAEGRHEMFNETNRDEVVRELLAWMS